MRTAGPQKRVSVWLVSAAGAVAVTGLTSCGSPTDAATADSTPVTAIEGGSTTTDPPSMSTPIESLTAEEIQQRRETWVSTP